MHVGAFLEGPLLHRPLLPGGVPASDGVPHRTGPGPGVQVSRGPIFRRIYPQYAMTTQTGV